MVTWIICCEAVLGELKCAECVTQFSRIMHKALNYVAYYES